jgi:EAL domain-containing protein (putative c-di-GMP-specific phosphodiesterase class I)
MYILAHPLDERLRSKRLRTRVYRFAYLINLPVDHLKIDGAFVKNVSNNLISQAIVEGFNRIAHAMNLETIAEFVEDKTIAEFVEDKTILEKLREIGVDYAQGYGISRPVPINFKGGYAGFTEIDGTDARDV